MIENYYFYVHKIGNKTMGLSPEIRLHGRDGRVVLSKKYGGEDIAFAVMLITRELQNSGKYQRIIIKKAEDKGCDSEYVKVYDWRMEAEAKEVRTMDYAEYRAKKDELKAKKKELEAEIAKIKAELAKLESSW